jgi:hypothetical protein
MRPAIVPGALFPDYELTDHATKRRKFRNRRASIRWSSCQAAEDIVRKIAGKLNSWFNFTGRWKLNIAAWSRSAPITSQKCRPYWDITTQEVKAAWKEGRKELFYPYGKSYAQVWGEQD